MRYIDVGGGIRTLNSLGIEWNRCLSNRPIPRVKSSDYNRFLTSMIGMGGGDINSGRLALSIFNIGISVNMGRKDWCFLFRWELVMDSGATDPLLVF